MGLQKKRFQEARSSPPTGAHPAWQTNLSIDIYTMEGRRYAGTHTYGQTRVLHYKRGTRLMTPAQ